MVHIFAIELILVGFVVFGFLIEDEIIKFERRLFRKIKRFFKEVKS